MSARMQILRNEVVRRLGLGTAGALLLALAVWAGIRLAGAYQLAAARGRFAAAVGAPPPARLFLGADGGGWERAFEERLGGPARLPDPAGLARMRQLLERAPSAWSAAETAECRRFLAVNASLLAAGERAADRRVAAPRATFAAVLREPASADSSRLWTRALVQDSLLRLRIHLALRDRSPAGVARPMEGLAASAEAFEDEPGMPFQLYALDLEKGLLKEAAAIAADPGVDARDLAAIRRLLPHRPIATRVRQLFAGEAGYLLATNGDRGRAALSAADLARLLDGYRRLALVLERGPGASPAAATQAARSSAGGRRTLPSAILALVASNFESSVQRIEVIAAARQLAELALDLRLAALPACAYPATLGGLPVGREPDPFTGRLPSYQRDAQGGALLSNPSAAAASEALPKGPRTKPFPFVWHLPPPCPPSAPAPRA
jgi:hypothetical protein